MMETNWKRTIAASMLLLFTMPLAGASPTVIVDVSTDRSIRCETDAIDPRHPALYHPFVLSSEDCDATVGYDDRRTMDARCGPQSYGRYFSTLRVTLDEECEIGISVLV